MNKLNNNIEEDYCSFEVCKLLKEKGFTQPTLCFYFEDGEFKQNVLIQITGMEYEEEFTTEYNELLENWNDGFTSKKGDSRCSGCSKPNGYLETFSSPTHTLAIKWIRENFGIWIETQHDGTFNQFTFKLSKLNNKNIKTEPHYMHPFGKGFNSSEEATDAALLYVLKNLI